MTSTTTHPATGGTMCAFNGLTVRQTIRQSLICHPDWDAIMHTQYLAAEEDTDVHVELVAFILHNERKAVTS